MFLPRRPRVPEDAPWRQLSGVRVIPIPAGEGGGEQGVLDVPRPGTHGLPQPSHYPGPPGDCDAGPLPPTRPGGPGGAAAAAETPQRSPAGWRRYTGLDWTGLARLRVGHTGPPAAFLSASCLQAPAGNILEAVCSLVFPILSSLHLCGTGQTDPHLTVSFPPRSRTYSGPWELGFALTRNPHREEQWEGFCSALVVPAYTGLWGPASAGLGL